MDTIKLLKKDFSYPDINADDFQKKIYEKREFYYHKIPKPEQISTYPELKKIREEICSVNVNLQSHQSLLANFTRLRKKFAMKLTYIVDACNNFIAFFFLLHAI